MARPIQHASHFAQDIGEVRVENRSRFFLSIPLATKHRKRWIKVNAVEVDACETVCEYLAVHKSIDGEGYSLTHVITGCCVARNLPDERAGQWLAGALMYLFAWSANRARINENRRELHPTLNAWAVEWGKKIQKWEPKEVDT